MKKALLLICFLLIIPTVSYGITLTGNLAADWNVNPVNGWWVPGNSTYQNGTVGQEKNPYVPDSPLTGVTPGGISYWVEAGNVPVQGTDGVIYYVGPGYGTECDIKAMYATNDSTNLYFAIALGDSYWAPYGGVGKIGDIGLSLNSGATYAYGVATQKPHPDDSSYNGSHNLDFGNLYVVSSWTPVDSDWASWNPNHLTSGPVRINTYGENLSAISYYYFGEYLDFYLIEGEIPLSLLNGQVPDLIHITQTCGNDVGNLQVARVPEPSTLLFLGLGLFGLAVISRRWCKIKVEVKKS